MTEVENPFKFGGTVTGEDFTDRESEMKEIIGELRGGTSIVLFSPRRMGKSSLLAELMRRHRKEMLFVYVDLYGITSRARFVEVFMSSLVSSVYGTVGKIAEGIKDVVRGSRFKMVINEKGEPRMEFSLGEPSSQEIQDILDLPEEFARRKGKRIAVIFDEFQEVAALDGVALLKAMRSRIQAHKHVSYVFTGSKKHLLMSIFEEREGAFFKSAKSMELGPIPKEDFQDFMIGKFASSGGRLSVEAASAVIDASGGNAYYAQQIAHELFNTTLRPRFPQDVKLAIEVTLAHQTPAFSYIWDSVKSQSHRRYLLATAVEGSRRPWSILVERYGLVSPSHIQRAVKQLDARGITEKGAIVDPLFAMWLRELAASGVPKA